MPSSDLSNETESKLYGNSDCLSWIALFGSFLVRACLLMWLILDSEKIVHIC